MSRSPTIIVQARMTSTRLPGKVLAPIAGRPMLAWQLDRLRRVRDDVAVAVATSDGPSDDPIVDLCGELGVPVVRGSEADVLDRYRVAAATLRADPVIRITSDCPLIDPAVSRAVLELFERGEADYASNTLERTFPRGLDTEVLSSETLAAAWHEASQPFEREHVTPYIYRNPSRFRLRNLRNERDEGYRRWTVDTPADLAFARAVYERLEADAVTFDANDVRELLRREPALEALNAAVEQKPLGA